MAGFNNYGGYGFNNGYLANYNQYPQNQNGSYNWNQMQQQQPVQQNPQPVDHREFVHGRAGADAYQLKPGVNMEILWDDETDRFYVKGYDNTGRPRVLADNDFMPHVEPEPQTAANIDLSPYATKDDIKAMINEALSGINFTPNMTGYVTSQEFDQRIENTLSNYCVGNGGRIVRNNESNA